MNRNRLCGTIAATLVFSSVASGYIRTVFTFGTGQTVFMKRTDATAAGVQFSINNQIAAGFRSSASGAAVTVISSGSNPVVAIRDAAATWNQVSTSAARFLALKSTSAVINSGDGLDTIAVGSTASDISALNGAVAVTVNLSTSFLVGSSPTGDVSDTDIILNPAIAFSTDGSTSIDLQAVMTHEMGHALGMDHSGLLGATMFQFTQLSQRYLSADELSFDTAVYPAAGATLGTLSGKVVAADSSAVQSALVELIRTANGNGLTALTGADGSYSVQAPAGYYAVYAEPLTGVVQAGNLYLLSSTVVTTNFQASVLGGLSSPTKIAVTAGSVSAVPNLTVTGGSSSLQLPFTGIGKAGGSGDIRNVLTAAPFVVASGQSIDIGLIGGGVDGTTSVQVIGQGISVHTGSVRVDAGISFTGSLAGSPLLRATLDINARPTPSVASIIIGKGAGTYALSGLLVIVPPTPTFTSKAVVSAASYVGSSSNQGGVSPGGIYSIYDTTSASLGPNPYVQPSGYDLYGNLATSLGGVSVTFDGVPAPLYLAYSGQINLQVPFEVAGKTSTQVVVNYNGSASVPVSVPVSATQPAFFTFTPLGMDAIAQNFPDYSLNSASNPAARGSVVLLYGTGLGNLGYALATGQPGIVPPSSYASKYSCSFGGQSASAYAYWNYGFVGEATWTVTIPSSSPTGNVALSCLDSVSGFSTQPATIYVK